MRTTLALTSAAAVALTAPVAAQQSVQDYTLPDPSATPTPAPRAQGPVDDSGIVPVAPRVIRTERPTVTPTPTPAPTPSPAVSEPSTTQEGRLPSPQPRFTSGPVPAEPLRRPTRTEPQGSAIVASALPSAAQSDGTTREPMDIPGLSSSPTAIPTEATGTEAAIAESVGSSPDAWPWAWIGGALVALLALVAGLLFWRRRGDAAPPAIEKPIVAAKPEIDPVAATEKPRIVASVQIESAQRSMMMVMVKYRLSIANRSDRALRGLSVSADLVSARRQGGLDAQLATLSTPLPQTSTIERIGPHQTGSSSGTLQLATNEIDVLRQGSTPMFVPLLRVRIEGENIDPHVETYAVGLGNGTIGEKLNPLPLDGPPGGYHGVRAKALTAKAA